MTRRQKYNVPIGWYEETLIKQGGGCAICGRTEPGGTGRFHVDHDSRCCPGVRSCGKCVGGLLCGTCNRGLGMLRHDTVILEKAIDYVNKTRRTELIG